MNLIGGTAAGLVRRETFMNSDEAYEKWRDARSRVALPANFVERVMERLVAPSGESPARRGSRDPAEARAAGLRTVVQPAPAAEAGTANRWRIARIGVCAASVAVALFRIA